MDLMKTFDDQVAQSEERIQKYAQLLEKAKTDPEMAMTQSLLAKTLESERAHKAKMEEMRARQREVTSDLAKFKRRIRVTLIVTTVVLVACMTLRFFVLR